MSKKRIRKKQLGPNTKPIKSLEGYEKHLLLEREKWREINRDANTIEERNKSSNVIRMLSAIHEHLRKYYFDL